MKRGGKIICSAAILAVAACAGQQGKLEVRPTKAVLAVGERPVPFRVAEGWGQLSLGNVGLALESFRKAVREDPQSVDALAGLAAAYDRMGRFDLSQRYYETALALAPANTQLLAALAASLDLQGREEEAASVRTEISQRVAAAAAVPAPASPSVGELPGFAVAAVQPRLAADPLAPEAAPRPQVAQPVLEVQIAPSAPEYVAAGPVEVAEVAVVSEMPAAVVAEVSPVVGRSVTVKLPAARPAAVLIAEDEQQPAAPTLPEEQPARKLAMRQAEAVREGPRIERLSMGEVALVTASGPLWRSQPVSSTARSATVRFVPVRPASDVAEVRLLNAARVHRLAARTRAYLAGRGWRGVSIGDAESTRRQSIIFYPEGQRPVARKLAAQFGFAIAPRKDVRQVTVMLGRDSLRFTGARAGA